MQFFTSFADRDAPITVDDVHKAFKARYPDEDTTLAFGPESDYDTGRQVTNNSARNNWIL